MKYLTNTDELEENYGPPVPASLSKVADHLTPSYSKWIDTARFCVLTTVGPEGTDASPRGEIGPVVSQQDEKTLLMPDWAGNNRIDSLRNIVRDNRISLMFMIPGEKNIVRVNGTGKITADEGLRREFSKNEKLPRTVLVITLQEVYFQCAKAIMRSELWADEQEKNNVPTAGDFLKEMTSGKQGGAGYDAVYESRAANQLWARSYD